MMPMRLHGLLIALMVLSPAAASARDVAACAALYKQLHNLRQVIGNTSEIRRYAQELAQINIEMRILRVDMRRSGCGGGSIATSAGDRAEICERMREDLQALENDRLSLVAERNDARLKQPVDERSAILATIRADGCLPSDVEEEAMDRLKLQGIALPQQEQPYSGIVELRTTPPAADAKAVLPQPNLPGPERPYDPNKKVRAVGPVFLPETSSIDLANPRSAGPQLEQ